MHTADQPDMFGHTPQQAEMFADEQSGYEPPKKLTADDIRQDAGVAGEGARGRDNGVDAARATDAHRSLS